MLSLRRLIPDRLNLLNENNGMLLKHLSIGKKLTSAFSLLCLLIIGIGLFSLLQFSRLNGGSQHLAEQVIPSITQAATIDYR